MHIDAALAFLDEHINREAVAGQIHGLSLDRMRDIVAVLGDPHRAAPVIQITGTNGKGSVARMISSVLAAHGLIAGVYASPHLERITERIQRAGEPIDDESFGQVIGELAALEPLFAERPSYFDLLTAAAYQWFATEAVDVMIMEVGLLGRFDSTNVADADVAVVTNVTKDHTDGQGDWRRRIAEEKAGIISPESAVVIGETDPELVEVFRAEGGRLHWVRGVDFGVVDSAVAIGGRSLDLTLPSGVLRDLFIPVHGVHQADNAALAVAAVEAFFGRELAHDTVAEGLGAVTLPGRFEVVGHAPLVVVDVAHNPAGTEAVAATMRSAFTTDGDLSLVVGLLAGRDPAEVLGPLLDLGPRSVVCTRPDSPRAQDPGMVADVVRGMVGAGTTIVTTTESAGEAVTGALDALRDSDVLLVTGSTYLAGEAREILRRRLDG